MTEGAAEIDWRLADATGGCMEVETVSGQNWGRIWFACGGRGEERAVIDVLPCVKRCGMEVKMPKKLVIYNIEKIIIPPYFRELKPFLCNKKSWKGKYYSEHVFTL